MNYLGITTLFTGKLELERDELDELELEKLELERLELEEPELGDKPKLEELTLKMDEQKLGRTRGKCSQNVRFYTSTLAYVQ